MTRLTSVLLCALIFGGLRLATDIYRTAYYGVELSWQAAILDVAMVCGAGGVGYLSGVMMLRRDLHKRTTVFIAFLGYFVSYSITRLLESMIVSPWVFVASLLVVTLLVTVGIGPKWEQDA